MCRRSAAVSPLHARNPLRPQAEKSFDFRTSFAARKAAFGLLDASGVLVKLQESRRHVSYITGRRRAILI